MAAFAANKTKITPSAPNGAYDESANTLTITGGGEVSFTQIAALNLNRLKAQNNDSQK